MPEVEVVLRQIKFFCRDCSWPFQFSIEHGGNGKTGDFYCVNNECQLYEYCPFKKVKKVQIEANLKDAVEAEQSHF